VEYIIKAFKIVILADEEQVSHFNAFLSSLRIMKRNSKKPMAY